MGGAAIHVLCVHELTMIGAVVVVASLLTVEPGIVMELWDRGSVAVPWSLRDQELSIPAETDTSLKTCKHITKLKVYNQNITIQIRQSRRESMFTTLEYSFR